MKSFFGMLGFLGALLYSLRTLFLISVCALVNFCVFLLCGSCMLWLTVPISLTVISYYIYTILEE